MSQRVLPAGLLVLLVAVPVAAQERDEVAPFPASHSKSGAGE